MAASSAATSAAMSYLYAPTDASVAEPEEETAFELQSAAGGEYTAPSGRAGGTSYAGWYVASETVVVAAEVRAPAEAAPFQSSPASDGESPHVWREPPHEDDASPPLPCRLNDVNKTSRRRLANAFDMSASETSARARLQSDSVMMVLHF